MTATTLLLALLALAYVGSMIMGGRGLRGYGLPSGAEYVLLGLVAGPHVTGLVDFGTLSSFQPIVATGAAWLALIIGVDYGYFDERRVSLRGAVLGLALALVTAAAVAAAAYYTVWHLTSLRGPELWLLAGGVGVVSSDSTQHAVRWVIERHGAKGPLCNLLADVADADDALPILGLGALLAFAPAPTQLALALPWWGAALVSVALGVVLGAVSAVLLRDKGTATDGWGALLGAALLATGAAWRLGWSALTSLFAMGIALRLFSRHRMEVRSLLLRTERPVLLPTLLLSGALVRIEATPILGALVLAAFVPRLVVRLLVGPCVGIALGTSLRTGASAGLGLLATGGFTVVMGLVYALRFPGLVGERVLTVAVAITLVGELIGPGSLRRALITSPAEPPESEADPLPEVAR